MVVELPTNVAWRQVNIFGPRGPHRPPDDERSKIWREMVFKLVLLEPLTSKIRGAHERPFRLSMPRFFGLRGFQFMGLLVDYATMACFWIMSNPCDALPTNAAAAKQGRLRIPIILLL